MPTRLRNPRWKAWRASLFGILVIAALCTSPPPIAGAASAAATCDTQSSLDDLARTFIGRCCKGSVNREFPAQWLDKALREIKAAADRADRDARKAWKLLSRPEYRKINA